MPRHYDDSQQHSASSAKTRRQQEDQRRMTFRRAIESYSEERRLNQELSDYLDAASANFWQSASAAQGGRQSARPTR
ncbi:PA3496 family putative envelope integrity protein [Pseudomonas sp. NPDC087358]|uniref:PA3496 family putative envelope integrity protein n=1 Tax=Pseudomonas sp. NPDC087358 TaxID=3364439 RepID=UPI00384B8F72